MNRPVKTTPDDPADPVDRLLYLNTADSKVKVYAGGDWRTLGTAGTSWWGAGEEVNADAALPSLV